MVFKIAVTGPESTGKSSLCQQLAEHYNTVWVEEFARNYLTLKGGSYKEEDLKYIAEMQLAQESEKIQIANKIIFCDTEFINLKIWSLVKFGRCSEKILNLITSNPYSLILLCNNDLPWEADPLRENPEMRDLLFSLFEKELSYYKFPYRIISGQGKCRLNNAIQSINSFLEFS